MRLKAILRALAFQGLGSRLRTARRLRKIASSNRLTVLNLHRIAPDDRSAYSPLEPELFEKLLQYVSKHFHVIGFKDLRQVRNDKPSLILSFDDGYRDFYDNAMPALDRYDIRVNQNIIPRCVQTGLPPLNLQVQDFVGKAPIEAIRAMPLPGFTFPEIDNNRSAIGRAMSLHLKNRPIVEQDQLAVTLSAYMLKSPHFKPTPMMSLSQIREAAKIHEIGAHTFAHASMAFENDEYLRQDIANCRKFFEQKLRQGLNIYALPNGSYRPEQLAIIKRSGIEHILLVDEDFARVGAQFIPRFSFYADSAAEMRFRATGLFRDPKITDARL